MLSDNWKKVNSVRNYYVLILVLMEYALWPGGKVSIIEHLDWVLILVLMEYALWLLCGKDGHLNWLKKS